MRSTVIIVHFAEDVPIDEGYRPLRYGRLAIRLRELGFDVVRVSPSFSHFRREQRAIGEFESAEGTHVVIETIGYEANLGADRAKSIGQFIAGTRRYLSTVDLDDAVLVVGVPPTGAVAAVRSVVGKSTPLIADIRDLWPDAMAVGRSPRLEEPFRLIGRVTSREVLLADAVVAVTETMAAWAPKRANPVTIPIGVPERERSTTSPTGGLRACFLSNHTHGFDFDTVLESWREFAATTDEEVSLDFIGAEPQTPIAQKLLKAEPTIRSLGRKLPHELPELLASYDLGLAPSKPEWSYSVGNKIFDYLASGLFVLHSMFDGVSDEIEEDRLGQLLPLTETAWTEAFSAADEARATSRSERPARIDRAEARYGVDAVCTRFAGIISELSER